MINPDYNTTKQLCKKCIYDKIRSKSPTNRAASPTCLHCDVTHLSLMTGIVALHIPSWRVRELEERHQARKTVWPVNAGRVICDYQNHLPVYRITNHHKHFQDSKSNFAVLNIMTINHIGTAAKTAASTRSPLWHSDCLTPEVVASVGNAHKSAGLRLAILEEDQELFVDFSLISLFMIWHSRQEDLQLFWLSFKHWL